jgi:hypothetical protein
MVKKIFSLVMIGFIIAACGSGTDEKAPEIDISMLDSLQTEVVLEIGESDAYLPGQLRALKRTPTGGYLVADWASSTIEQFDEAGNHRATIAKGGKGPGEMGNYFMFRNTGNDTLLVNQIINTQRDYFVPGGDGIYRFVSSEKQASRPERSFSIIGAQSDTSYYATVGGFFSFNESDKSDYKSSAVAVVNSSGELLQDSVQMYKSANLYVVRSDNSVNAQNIPFRFDDDLTILANGSYLVARIDSNAIFKYGPDHALEKKIPVNIATRPVTSADIDKKLGDDIDSKTRNALEAKISDKKPPFLNVWATQQHIWLHTDNSPEEKEMVVLDYDGNTIGKFMLPEVDSIQEIKENRIYTIHRSPTRGDLIRVYQIDI